MNVGGLLLEGAPPKDFGGVLGAVVVSYLLVPFQAYAALKGLFEKEEGPWFRTPKTGKITDPVKHLRRLYRLRKWLFGNGNGNGKGHGGLRPAPVHVQVAPPLRRPARRIAWIVTIAMVCALAGLGLNAVNAPVAEAAGTSLFLHGGTCPSVDGTMNSTSSTSTTKTWSLGTANQTCQWATTTSTTAAQTIFTTDVFTFNFWAVRSNGAGSPAISAVFGYSSLATCTTVTTIASMATYTFNTNTTDTQFTPPTFSPASNVSVPSGSFFCWTITVQTADSRTSFEWDSSTDNTNLNSSQTIFIPEFGLLFIGLVPFLPALVRRLRNRKSDLRTLRTSRAARLAA
jgi:hypothetical protein